MNGIVILALVVLFFQMLHIFEEIALEAYKMEKGDNPLGKYLRVASVLILVSIAIIICLVLELPFAPYAALFMVALSLVNVVVHTRAKIKKQGRLGYGFPSVIPYGISGLLLLWMLVNSWV